MPCSCALLETTSIRVGNREYARTNRSFGLTTLRSRHVRVEGGELRFRFRGKSGRVHEVGVEDRRLARIVARCQELPGQELFQYLDGSDEPQTVESADVNDYLRDAAGIDVTAKDFRTWTGTMLAFGALRSASDRESRVARRTVTRSTEAVAEALGNTPAVTRGSYIAPAVIDAYLAGSLPPGRRPGCRTTMQALRHHADLPARRARADPPAGGRRAIQVAPLAAFDSLGGWTTC